MYADFHIRAIFFSEFGIAVTIHHRVQFLLIPAIRTVVRLKGFISRNIAGIEHGLHGNSVDGFHCAEHGKDGLNLSSVVFDALRLLRSVIPVVVVASRRMMFLFRIAPTRLSRKII